MNPIPGQSGAANAQDDTIFRTLAAYADALDALPLDLTRSFSDLRELDAVLGAHLNSLTSRLQHLTAVIQDPTVSPGERLLALRDVAEEARGYKMGGEDKIRVAVTTAETIISHTDYIASLLANLRSVPSLRSHLSPSDSQVDLNGNPILENEYYDLGVGPSSLQSRINNSYPGGVDPNAASMMSGSGSSTKKRKAGASDTKGKSSINSSLMNANDSFGLGGSNAVNSPPIGTSGPGSKKRKTASGKESSNGAGLANLKEKEKTRKVNSPSNTGVVNQPHSIVKDHGSSRGSYDEQRIRNDLPRYGNKNGTANSTLGSRGNPGSRDSARFDDHDGHGGHFVDNVGPALSPAQNQYDGDYRSSGLDGNLQRSYPINDPRFRESNNPQASYVASSRVGNNEEFYSRAHPVIQDSNPGFSNSSNFNDRRLAPISGPQNPTGNRIPSGNSTSGGRGEDDAGDETRYCYCDRVSFGEMMGCDDEDCPKEWFHLECTGYKAPPEGTWYCDICTERRSNQAARGKGKAKGPYSRKGKR